MAAAAFTRAQKTNRIQNGMTSRVPIMRLLSDRNSSGVTAASVMQASVIRNFTVAPKCPVYTRKASFNACEIFMQVSSCLCLRVYYTGFTLPLQ